MQVSIELLYVQTGIEKYLIVARWGQRGQTAVKAPICHLQLYHHPLVLLRRLTAHQSGTLPFDSEAGRFAIRGALQAALARA